MCIKFKLRSRRLNAGKERFKGSVSGVGVQRGNEVNVRESCWQADSTRVLLPLGLPVTPAAPPKAHPFPAFHRQTALIYKTDNSAIA